MLLSQRPLSPAAPDASLAIGSRVELAKRIARNTRRRRNTLILGRRGSGRTSALALVERELRSDESYVVRRIDAEGCDDALDLAAAVLAALGDDPRGPTTQTVTWQERFGLDTYQDRSVVLPRSANETDAARIADAARRVVTDGAVAVLLVDNLHPGPGHDLFGRFRDALWAAPIVWIAAGDGDRSGYLDAPADVFWESVVWLEPLDGDEVSELLKLRIEAAGKADLDAAAVLKQLPVLVNLLKGSTPREVVRGAAELVDSGSIDAAYGSSQRFGRAHAAGGRSASMLLAEVERLGRPVHAGDEELLTRMGLTRPRVVQLLNSLEQAGLVQRHREGKRILFEAKP
jgi:hypothetical protein